MGDEQRDGDCDIDGDDGGDYDETLGFQDMVVRRSEERSEPCPVRRLFYKQNSPSLPLPLDEGEKAGCSSSTISRYRLPGRAVSVAPARYDCTSVRAGGKRQVGARANGL